VPLRPSLRPILTLAPLGVVAGCGWPFASGGCSASLQPAIEVEIRDARTSVPLAGLARGIVRDGAYVDSLMPAAFLSPDDVAGSMISRQAALERPGTYMVLIERVGYRPWVAVGVQVDGSACHVKTRRLQARLMAA
jgi:hypothetical protein